MKHSFTFLLLLFSFTTGFCQISTIKGRITSAGEPLAYASIGIIGTTIGGTSNDKGYFEIKKVTPGSYELTATSVGYQTEKASIVVEAGATVVVNFNLMQVYSKLEEVVVTGVSQATQIKKSPIPIATISKKEIDINVNSNIIDAIVKGVPGVSSVSTGPNISKPFIRGLGYNRVLTLYDGIRQEGQQWGDEHGSEIDQYSIERAEVVKGPASLTYGSDALAGVINMIPYVPNGVEGVLKGDAVAEYHTNNGRLGTSVGISYRQKGWKYYLRASGKQAHDYQNKVDGYVYGSSFKEYNFSGSVRVEKKWGFSQLAATTYENFQEIPDGSRDSLSRQFTKPIFSGPDDNIKNRPIVSNAELKSYSISPLHQRIQHYRLYSHNQYNVGSGSLNATVGLQRSVRREYLDPIATNQAALYLVLNTLNYDLRYILPTWHAFETTIGVNGMAQDNQNKEATSFPIPDYRLFDIGTFVYTRKTLGKFDVSGGIRYDSRHLSWENFYVGLNPITNQEQQVSANTPGANLQFPAFNTRYQGVSGNIGTTYNLSDRLLLKANLARGYRSPNITEVGSNGLDPGAHIIYLGNRTFKPEFNFQMDFSFLAYLKNLDISLEIFDNQIRNYIYQGKVVDSNGKPLIDAQGNLTYQYQQAQAHLYGTEISINLHPEKIKWLALNNSLAYVKGLNRNERSLEIYGDAAKHLPFIPPLHYRTELRTTVQKSVGFLTGLYARIELDAYADKNDFYGVDNTETFTKGFTLINAGVGSSLKQKSGRIFCQLFFQVDNLFDVAYQSHLNRLKYFEYYSASPNGRLGIFNMGRNFSSKIIIPF